MSSLKKRGLLFGGVGLLSIVIATGSAQAQLAAAPAAGESAATGNAGSDIVVTGTRIKRPDLESNSPLTAVSSAEIEYQGATTVEGVLNRLPQFTAAENENVSNGSDGTSKVNLRNLGSNRVLVLIDGKRMLPQQAVNLNFVPSALVERIDVMTGGASAVYGSDALSGVVNFVLRSNLDGIRLDAQTSFAQHENNNQAMRSIVSGAGYALAPRLVADGGKQDVNFAAGKNFADGRGNITVFAGYRHFDPVLQSSRDVSSCGLNQADDAGTALVCGGSSNTPYGTWVPLAGPNQGATLTNSRDGSRTWVPYNNSYAYNYSPTNYFQRSDNRVTAGGFGKFEIAPAATVYGSFMYMRDHTFSQAAPSALFLGNTYEVPCNTPLASASQLTALCGAAAGTSQMQPTMIGYRMAVAPRRDDLRYNDYRYTVGVRGDIGSGFSYDVSYLRSIVRYAETYLNNVDLVKSQRALDVVNVNGTPTCRSVVDGSDPNCIPVNVFMANGVTPQQAKYMFTPSNTGSRNTQEVISGTLSGDLGKLGIQSPWANHGLGIALGFEHRRETLNFWADAIAQQGGATNSDGVITVNEGYGEIEVPILADLPFAHALTINGGARYSAYHNEQKSTGFSSNYNVWTYKGELDWEPVVGARLRASYNHAIRAPNITELFASQSVGNVAAQDPCSGATPKASAQACALTGVTQQQYGSVISCPADTCSALGGGNRALKPETGDTWTAGIVLTPKQLRRLSLSVDYYHIKVKDYINSIDPSLIISQCTDTQDPYYCGLFKRDPRSGAIFGTNGYIVSTTLNTGYLKTSGIDVNADYTFNIGKAGKVNLNLVGTYVIEQVSQPLPGLGSYDCKGLFGYTCGQPNPAWRHVLRTTWTTPDNINVSLAWRHIGGTQLSSLSSNPALSGSATSIVNRRIGAYNYFDLTMVADVTKDVQVRMGVNNLLDKDPPVIAAGILSSFGNGNTYPGVYDALGRTIFFGTTLKF